MTGFSGLLREVLVYSLSYSRYKQKMIEVVTNNQYVFIIYFFHKIKFTIGIIEGIIKETELPFLRSSHHRGTLPIIHALPLDGIRLAHECFWPKERS